MIDNSENLNELFAAMSKAQGEIANATNDKTNPHFKSDYASLAAVLDIARPALSKHGLTLIQMPTTDESGAVCIVTRLGHSSGQWIQSSLPCHPQQKTAWGIGSVISYLRRYSASSFVGIAQTDDDGNSVSQPITPAENKQKEQEAEYSPQEKAEAFRDKFLQALDAKETTDAVKALVTKQQPNIDEVMNISKVVHGKIVDAIDDKLEALARGET